jgi:glycerophosphoryl diester phosphodiesterase
MNLLTHPHSHPVVGHRGMAAAAPENTIEAMRLAFSHGADAVEFDLRLSADGEVVVFHDPTVDRTTDGLGPIASKTVAELRELNAGARFRAGVVEDRLPPPRIDEKGELFPEYRTSTPHPRVSIPLFREVLEEFPDRHLLIEIKDPAAALPARQLLEKFSAQNRCLVDSYSAAALEVFRGSGIPVGAGKEGVVTLLKSFFLMRRHELVYDGMCIPTNYKSWPLPVGLLRRIAHSAGKIVHIWTVNSTAEARSLWHLGVNGIITDDVRPMIAERNRK